MPPGPDLSDLNFTSEVNMSSLRCLWGLLGCLAQVQHIQQEDPPPIQQEAQVHQLQQGDPLQIQQEVQLIQTEVLLQNVQQLQQETKQQQQQGQRDSVSLPSFAQDQFQEEEEKQAATNHKATQKESEGNQSWRESRSSSQPGDILIVSSQSDYQALPSKLGNWFIDSLIDLQKGLVTQRRNQSSPQRGATLILSNQGFNPVFVANGIQRDIDKLNESQQHLKSVHSTKRKNQFVDHQKACCSTRTFNYVIIDSNPNGFVKVLGILNDGGDQNKSTVSVRSLCVKDLHACCFSSDHSVLLGHIHSTTSCRDNTRSLSGPVDYCDQTEAPVPTNAEIVNECHQDKESYTDIRENAVDSYSILSLVSESTLAYLTTITTASTLLAYITTLLLTSVKAPDKQPTRSSTVNDKFCANPCSVVSDLPQCMLNTFKTVTCF